MIQLWCSTLGLFVVSFFMLMKLTELESSLLSLADPQFNSIQEVLHDYDKRVRIFFNQISTVVSFY